MDLKTTSIKAKNYKSLGEKLEGFEAIYPINLIVGKNNTGKSALLDVIDYCSKQSNVKLKGRVGKRMEVYVSYLADEQLIKDTFRDNQYSPGIGNVKDIIYGQKWLNKKVTCRIDSDKTSYHSFEKNDDGQEMHTSFNKAIQRNIINPISSYIFRRIRADRDITNETRREDFSVSETGKGSTSTIEKILHQASENISIIEKDLLEALNTIFYPDFKFERILARDDGRGKYEIVLEEDKKGLVGLSDSGSGLKTVLLVLLNTVVLPKKESNHLSRYIFAFEELENNLHPGTQRRLFSYLKELAVKEQTHFFITTHSSVAIDMFSGDDLAQIIHITNDGQDGKADVVQGYSQYGNIIDDLDVRASDLLQSNSIIWVEGPSDRVYINKWIELVSGDRLKEGRHYQCVFYGGKLLARLQATLDEEDVDKEINILSVNRHSILVMDRDKNDAITPVNDTKKRMIKEIEQTGGLSWLTAGREIENYIPQSIIARKYHGNKLQGLGQFERYKDYLENIEEGLGEKFAENKNVYASEIAGDLILEDLHDVYDLKIKITEVCNKICDWNNIPHIN